MKVIIAGSRHITNMKLLEDAIKESKFNITQVISGCAKGVDKLGEQWAYANKIPVNFKPADWKKYGKAAGPIRNEQMAKIGEALIAIRCPHSRGTRNMIKQAAEYGLDIYVCHAVCSYPHY